MKLCIENDEENKYLMTFQNLLSTIPNWNNTIIETERKREREKERERRERREREKESAKSDSSSRTTL